MSEEIVKNIAPLQFPWQTLDPFLFCVHHDDAYPRGDQQMAPDVSLAGRAIGHDFSGKDGWSMYHGDTVPGFPRHPHRGFETITVARQGFIDHADSLGATARFGKGDVQWMTAGEGVVHSEMFPLVNRDAPNPTELFQIWLNLPREGKMVEPHFTMFWADGIPQVTLEDDDGGTTELTIIAGGFDGAEPLPPPPDSWAADPASDVAVWTLRMSPNAKWTVPSASPESNRALYLFEGEEMEIAGETVRPGHFVEVEAAADIRLRNGGEEAELLMLQGRPIGEPVVQRGPFVMNSIGGIKQTMLDYQRTGFGGWPWESPGPVHDREQGRFAIHADGREEYADG